MSLRKRLNCWQLQFPLYRVVELLCFALVILSCATGQTEQATRQISYGDLPLELYGWLNQQGVSRENFAARISSIRRQTDERELAGEFDHLIFFLLQSSRFTTQPKIEPAISAYEFAQNLSEPDRVRFLAEGSDFAPAAEKIPKSVRARIGDFVKALKAKTQADDERLSYFDNLLRKTVSSRVENRLSTEYIRAMRFLYQKEFASRSIKQDEVAAYVASLYQTRGHSTDTQIEANFAVFTALASLKASSPEIRLNRVLIVGPGLDFAPRTDLIDVFGPQSYQPFAIADALLRLQLADESKLQIHCADINERVLDHFRTLRQRREVRLSILTGVKESAAHPIADDYKTYFKDFGNRIGVESNLDVPPQASGNLAGRMGKSLRVRPEIVKTIRAHRLNIVTDRFADSQPFDLVIVTNVFPYFSAPELLFALTNISAMTATNGYLIHNELQTVPSTFVNALGLPLRQARTVMITSDKAAPLFDGVAIHQKIFRQ